MHFSCCGDSQFQVRCNGRLDHSKDILEVYWAELTVVIILLTQMSSPARAERQIEQQIKKRILPDALTPNDLEFYIRKVRRLEADNSVLQDEQNKLRIKLRRAEDFQIKYQALLTQNLNIKKQLDAREKIVRDLKAHNQKTVRALQDKKDKTEEWNAQKQKLLEEIERCKGKAEDSELRRVSELASERVKNEDNLKRQLSQAKRDFEEKEDQLKFEIRQLQKIIHEKQTIEGIINGRVEKIRREKDEQIKRLTHIIEDEKENFSRSVEEKNEQIDRLKEKFQKMINFEVQNIKNNLEDQGEVFTIELNGLKQIISIKNDEITKLLAEVKRQASEHAEDRKQLLSEVASLKQKIYEVQKEGELELNNLRQKLTQIHAADLKSLEQRYEDLIGTLRDDKIQLENFLQQKDKQREADRRDYEKTVSQLIDKIKERDQRITSLLQRIKDSGDINTGELRDLHQTFHKIEVEKEVERSEYQNKIAFMTQQIAKLTAANQVKNNELKKIYAQMRTANIKYEDQIKNLQENNKRERKEREQDKQRQRKQREKMQENQAAMQREFKNTEARLQREKDKEQREKNKLSFLVEELERDVDRLNKYIKQLDDNLKNEFLKNQMNILESGGSRRELTSQLQKQKVQTQTFWKIQIDQIKRKYEIDTSRLTQQNQKLKTDILNKSLALQKAQTQLKKIDYQHRNLDKITKQKILDYEKKMATLNSEINLTQQLYQSFLQAKSRKKS